MQVGVLCAQDSWYFKDLLRAAGGRHRLSAVSFGRIGAALGGGEAPGHRSAAAPLDPLDAVLVRTMPPGTLEQIVFRMDVLGQLEAAGTKVVNPPRAIEVAVDKYLAQARLHAAGLDTPRALACQTADEAMDGFASLGGDVVVKPLFGGEGRGLMRISDPDLALRAYRSLEQLGAVIYQQEFIAHEGCDVRVLVIGDRLLAMRRRHPTDWRTNVARGAIAEPLVVNDRLERIARCAAAAVGGWVTGVDILPARDGRLLTLEVNAVPGWRALRRALNTDIAALVLDFVEHLVARRS